MIVDNKACLGAAFMQRLLYFYDYNSAGTKSYT